MLYIKSKNGKVFIQDGSNSMVINPNRKGYYSHDEIPYFMWIDQELWDRLLRKVVPLPIEENSEIGGLYKKILDAIEEDNQAQQEMADMDHMMMQAEKEWWRQAGSALLKSMAKQGIQPLATF